MSMFRRVNLIQALAVVATLWAALDCQAQSTQTRGTVIGPGVGGQVHAFAFEPDDTVTAYAGGDVCGIYKYTYDNSGGQWVPWSEGLGYADLNRSFYVEDLLVLGSQSPVAARFQGVYAATQGGVYFRGRFDASWHCITADKYYTGGYAAENFWNGSLRVPFSSLAFDPVTLQLFAGAGHARISDGAAQFDSFYPAQGLRNGAANSLWACDLRPDAPTQSFLPVHDTAHGNVRQVTVANYSATGAMRSEVAYACDAGIFVYSPANESEELIWTPMLPNKSTFDINVDAADPWGVAAGSDGTLYALMSRRTTARTPGLWSFRLAAADRAAEDWNRIVGDDSLWPHPGTWTGFVSPARDSLSDLTELSVHGTPEGDEIFVGEGHDGHGFGQAGYFRFGWYDPGTGRKRGWAHVHRTTLWAANQVADVIGTGSWRAGQITETTLTAEQKGWHAFAPSLRALVPFAVHPTHQNIMAGVDYGMPLMTHDGGASWKNLYCKPSNGGWETRGLNIMCSRGSAVLPDGRLLLAALDYGVFCSTPASGGRSFIPLHSPGADPAPSWPSAVDIEVVPYGGAQEVYMVQDARTWTSDKLIDRVWRWEMDASGAHWDDISEGLEAAAAVDAQSPHVIKIVDVVFASPDELFAAVGLRFPGGAAEPHYYIFRAARAGNPSNWAWNWSRIFDADARIAHNGISKVINRICLMPRSTKLIYGAKTKSMPPISSPGGLYWFDYAANTQGAVQVGGTESDVEKISRNVTAIAVDSSGRYVYVGGSGHDTPTTVGRPGVLRLTLDNGIESPPTVEVLAGKQGVSEDVFEIGPVENFHWTNIGDWEFCTRINDIEISRHNPLVAYFAVGYGNFPMFHAKYGAWRLRGVTWEPVWGGNETGSGAMTLSINSDGTELYVGSAAQEFFAVDVLPPETPAIAANAQYELMANTSGAVHALAVAVAPANATSVVKVTADRGGWGGTGAEELYDDGEDPDLEPGDGIFTSRRIAAAYGAPGTYSVSVTAKASDGGLAQRNVQVEVVATSEVPVVDSQAAYRVRAGSTDASRVLAVTVSTPAGVTRVSADLSGLGGAGLVRLRDDGEGEDIKPGDGIFTSPLFAAGMPTPGAYGLTVTASPMTGTVVQQLVGVAAASSAAKFKDDSRFEPAERIAGDLESLLTGRPYAAVYFKARPADAASEDVLVVTFDDNDRYPLLFGKNSPTGFATPFERHDQDATPSWLAGPIPKGCRGVSYADYDNDGDVDFFVCNPTYGGKLYRNDLPSGFSDVTAAVFGVDVSHLAGASTASWGDYNSDGFIDLLAATTPYAEPIDELPMSAQYNAGSTGDMRLFKNTGFAQLRKSQSWGQGMVNACLAACWVDLDNDGDLDHLSSRFVDVGLTVLENGGINAAHTDNIMLPVIWAASSTYLGASSITVIDYDHDAYPDLLVTEAGSLHQARILRNNFENNQSRTFTSIPFATGTAWSGAIVADLNLDGQDDFLLLPKEVDVSPALFVSNGYTSAPSFEDVDPMVQYANSGANAPAYRDLGYTLGLRDGATGGGFAIDLDNDHALDLLLGRSSASSFLYRNVGSTTTTGNWLQVDLRSAGDSNGSLIGTTVTVTAGTKRWTKAVDGGSGRGGQSPNTLVFGLGDVPIVSAIEVRFPSGEVDTVPLVNANQAVIVTEDAVGAVVARSASFSYELQPGLADWIFKWKTTGIKGDLRQDQVSVWPYDNASNACRTSPPFTLGWDTPGVSVLTYKDGTSWQHELRWSGSGCIVGCQWNWQGFSSAGEGSSAVSQTPTRLTAPLTYCIPENYGQ